jgi:carboxyl-terminal processing protease
MKFATILFTILLSLPPALAAAQEPAGDEPATDTSAIPLDEIRTFTEVFAKVKNDYVEAVDDRQLLESAIRGMLEGLDPHSAYLDEDEYLDLQEGTTGEFGGLGIEVGLDDGFIRVISPIDDTPAERAGVRAGDIIVRLDEKPVKGMSLNDAVKMMRGDPGTQITLTILRDGEQKPLTLAITRDTVKVRSVRRETLEPGFGYVRVSQFQLHTADDLKTELEALKQENDGKLAGIVLDLRNNPGGVLSSAVAVSDLFLERGLIVYTEGRIKDSTLRFNARPQDLLDEAPLVVLVNAGSASASEIVAGALQDHKRAVVMGQKTFGKGSVQTILPMANQAALKLTTARYYTPSGRSIQAEGIVPDIEIDPVRIEAVDDSATTIKEQDLSGHLENTDAAPGAQAAAARRKPLAASDYALYEALNVLKGLALLRTTSG